MKKYQPQNDKFLITFPGFHSYPRPVVVWYVTAKEAGQIRKILEDFYYGNLTPGEKRMRSGSKLQCAVNTAAQCEEQLAEGLNETERGLLARLVTAQHEIDSITAAENFILGFRLGVRIMAECMDENDGDIRSGGE